MRFVIVISPFSITQTNGTQLIVVPIIGCFQYDYQYHATIALKIGNTIRSLRSFVKINAELSIVDKNKQF